VGHCRPAYSSAACSQAKFAPGDEVFGQLLIPPLGSTGVYAEYVAVTEEAPLGNCGFPGCDRGRQASSCRERQEGGFPMTVATDTDVRVEDVRERSRFEVRAGDELAGFAEYRRRPGMIAFIHTLIDPRFEGGGLASRMVRFALTQARSEGLVVLPFCPFVRAFIADHPADYLDLVPADQRSTFDLPAHV
jgi:predicted GNAT family acetyltransferase